jgi:hypothetical protein
MPREHREYDAFGRLAPRHLRGVFRGRRRLKKWVWRLNKFRNQLAVLGKEPFGRHIDVHRVLEHLEAARALVIRGLPYLVCDCPGWKLDCPKCEGQRWHTVDRGAKRPPAWRP